MAQSLKDALRGCYEIPLFLPQGVARFENSKAAFVQSLLIPVALLPLQALASQLDPELSQLPVPALLVVLAHRTLMSSLFFLGTTWLLCWPLERQDRFFRFATAYNWLGITGYALILPYLIPAGLGLVTSVQMANYLVFFVGFVCVITAFTARHALNIGWAMAVPIGFGVLLAEIMSLLVL